MSVWWKIVKSRVIAWSFIPTILILSAVAIVTFVAYEKVSSEQVISRDEDLTSIYAGKLREELKKYSDVLASLARSRDIYLNNIEGQRATLNNARLKLTVFDGGVILLDHFGKVTASEPDRPEIIGQDWSHQPFFSQLLTTQGPVFSDIIFNGANKSPVVLVAVPIIGDQGEFLGTLTGMFRIGSPTISALYASIIRIRIGDADTVYLVDGQGRVIYHPDPTMIGTDLSRNSQIKQVITGNTGAIATHDTSGRYIVVSYAPVPDTSWGLVTDIDWSTLNRPSALYGQILLALLALGMVLPAASIWQQVRQRQAEISRREQIENELRFARSIQQTLLPREVPDLRGWKIAAYWQPAREVGGDFYDFLYLPDGKLGIVIGDVTDKGVPAALVMASARSIIRGSAERFRQPGMALVRANNLLCADIPENMFVTCMFAILDPVNGHLVYANAGQNLPYRICRNNGSPDAKVVELRATGMPLGLMRDMVYEERETFIDPGDCLVFYSDGLVEAHNPQRKMYGNPHLEDLLQKYVSENADCSELIQYLRGSLVAFTGPNWEQEDDVTIVTINRLPTAESGYSFVI